MDFERLVALHSQGVSLKRIAAEIGRSVATVSQVAIAHGLRRKPSITDDQREQIREMADAYPFAKSPNASVVPDRKRGITSSIGGNARPAAAENWQRGV